MGIVAFASVFMLRMASPKRMETIIQTTGDRELPCPPQNIQSQVIGSSVNPAPMCVVVLVDIRLMGMASPKAALDSNAIDASVSDFVIRR